MTSAAFSASKDDEVADGGPLDDDKDPETCVICCTPLRADDAGCRLQCGHSQWHKICVSTWLANHCTCPVCRAPVQLSETESDDDADHESHLTSVSLDSIMSLLLRTGDVESTLHRTRDALLQQLERLENERILLETQAHNLERDLFATCEHLSYLDLEYETDYKWEHSTTSESELSPSASSSHTVSKGPSAEDPQWPNASLDPSHADSDSNLPSTASASAANDSIACSNLQEVSPQNCLGSVTHSSSKISTTNTCSDRQSHMAAAVELLCRVRGAVLRSQKSAGTIFRALAPHNGRIMPDQIGSVLREFQHDVSVAIESQVFALLDVRCVGYVDEPSWLAALQFPPEQGAEIESQEATALLARVAHAIQRSNRSACETFYLLHNGEPCDFPTMGAMLNAFGASPGAVALAVRTMDMNGSGLVEEEDFCVVMEAFLEEAR